MSRARISVRGLVQGVFFRAETRRMAVSLGLKGWVRNMPDGTVQAVFEGERAVVEKAVEWCRHGPAGARVEDLGVSWEDARGEAGFEVLYG
jgi:acylphosphatase